MYNIFVIYRQILDARGQVEKIEIVEADIDEASAIRYTKFHSNQVSHDLRQRISYSSQAVRVV
jgi:hypothetical protein